MSDYKSGLLNLDGGQIDQLVASGQLRPEQAATIKASQTPVNYQDVSMGQGAAPVPEVIPPTGSYSQDQIGIQMANAATPSQNMADSNLSMAQASPEAFNAVQSSMASIGAKPISMPTPLSGAPAATPEIQQQADIDALAKAQADAAHSGAAQGMAQFKQKEQERTLAAAEAKDKVIDEQVKKDMEEEGGWGQRIGQAIAIMMGSMSQGLTGAKENPAVVAIEKEVAKQAAARKYTQEQKEKMFEHALKMAGLEMDKKKFQLDSLDKQMNWKKLSAEIGKLTAETKAAKDAAALGSKLEYTMADLQAIPNDPDGRALKATFVRMPNGNFRPAVDDKGAQKARDVQADTDSALFSGKALLQKIEYFGNNPGKKILDRAQVAEAQTLANGLIGAIKLPYIGPGAVSDTERKILESIARDPSAIFSLSSANKASIQTVVAKVKHYRNSYYRSMGVDVPPSANEETLAKWKKIYPAASEPALINSLVKQGKWNPNEE